MTVILCSSLSAKNGRSGQLDWPLVRFWFGVWRTKYVACRVKDEIVLVFNVSVLHSPLGRDCGESYVVYDWSNEDVASTAVPTWGSVEYRTENGQVTQLLSACLAC